MSRGRPKFSKRQRLHILERAKSICCVCGLPIFDRKWTVEHKRARELFEDPTEGDHEDNLGPAHNHCAAAKTYGDEDQEGDLTIIARAKRKAENHKVAWQSTRPLTPPWYVRQIDIPVGKKYDWRTEKEKRAQQQIGTTDDD